MEPLLKRFKSRNSKSDWKKKLTVYSKLYAAYEQQEKEPLIPRLKSKFSEKEIVEREIEKEGLEALLTEKDARIRDAELRSSKTSKQVEHLEPELQKMEEKYAREKDRLGKVFSIAEELDNDLRLAVVELQTRRLVHGPHVTVRGSQQGD